MSTLRWVFADPATLESVVVPINPNKMDAPTRPRSMVFASAARGTGLRGMDQVTPAAQWNFSGVLLTEAHYNLLLSWTARLTRVHITDHLERTFEVVIQKFDPVERLPTATKPWRADYTMTCLLLKEL